MSVDTPTRTEYLPVRRGNGWRIVGGVFSVFFILAGAVSVASLLARQTEVQDQVYQRTVTQIVVEIGTGDLTVMPANGGVSVHRHLKWSWTKPTIQESWDGTTLTIRTRCPAVQFGSGCGVDYTLRVPADVSLITRNSTGDVTVNGIRGDLALSTSTGDIRLTGASRALSLHTSTGDINASKLTSSEVDANVSTGDVTLGFDRAPTSVHANTSTGDVRITVPAGDPYRVEASTNTGDTDIRVVQNPTSTNLIAVRTHTGDIWVRYA